MRVIGLIGTVLYIVGVLIAREVTSSSSVAQQATPTPQGIYGVLLDTNALIYCQIVQEPIDPIFQTATAAPTKTTVPIASPTFVMPPTPTQEIWTPAATLTTTAALNLRECAGTACKILLVIPANQKVTAFNERQQLGSVWWRRIEYNGIAGWVSESFLK